MAKSNSTNERTNVEAAESFIVEALLKGENVIIPDFGHLELKSLGDNRKTVFFKEIGNDDSFLRIMPANKKKGSAVVDDLHAIVSAPLKEGKTVNLSKVGIFKPKKLENGVTQVSFMLSTYMRELLNNGIDVLLDRYVESNMGHQGGKLNTPEERLNMYKWLESLEYGLLELPRPDLTLFLYMPYQYALELKKNRKEAPDQHEVSENHLINAENAFLELSKLYGFKQINCIENGKIRTKEKIHEEVYSLVKKL